jgi:hypothetical protein
MGSLHVVLFVAGAGTVALLVGSRLADAKPACTAEAIAGSYGYTVTGTNVGLGPGAAVGLVALNGSGGLTASDTLSFNGTIIRRTITGSYSVNANCTGAATFTDNNAQTTHLDFVVVADRQEVHFVETDPGTVFTGLARRQ